MLATGPRFRHVLRQHVNSKDDAKRQIRRFFMTRTAAPGKSCRARQRLINHARTNLPTCRNGWDNMASIEDMVGPDDLAALEAELPRKKWNGKRTVATAGLVAALVGGIYAATIHTQPSTSQVSTTPHYVEVPDMMVNLRTPNGERRYLKVRVTLEAASAKDAIAIEAKLPAIIDGFQSFLRELRPEDLAGSSGTFRIKEELMIRVNRAAEPGRASNVLVQELIQQ